MSKRGYTVPETAEAVGVSSARVYQRISGEHAPRGAGKLLKARTVKRGVRTGRGRGSGQGIARLLVPESAVNQWRNERIQRGLPVGNLRPLT
jgi:predicted DNA-binding transcriptional regulator AlpA